MTFWDHLDELRGVLFRIGGVVIALAIAFFFVMRWFFDHVIMWPCRADFPLYPMLSFINGDGDFLPNLSNADFSVKVINITLGSQLMTHLSASLWMALAFSFPLIIYLLWGFISPGLYENERRGARKAFLFGNVMFYLGVLVGYFIVFPLALRFLSEYQLSASIENTLTLDSYMDNFYSIIVALGVVFELPLLAWMLGKMGLLKRSFFKKYRRHAIVGLAALSAFITPTSDVFTLAVVFCPLYCLWEFSSRLVPKADPE
jgi:sec-independent protein translocase protein TatC